MPGFSVPSYGERSQVVQGACLWHRRSRVRIPSLAPHEITPQLAPVAQRIEYWASDPGVVGSNPARRAKRFTPLPANRRSHILRWAFPGSCGTFADDAGRCGKPRCLRPAWGNALPDGRRISPIHRRWELGLPSLGSREFRLVAGSRPTHLQSAGVSGARGSTSRYTGPCIYGWRLRASDRGACDHCPALAEPCRPACS